MKILPKPVLFEWDKGNFDKNFKKHKVVNEEAEQIFNNSPNFIHRDESHSTINETRYMIWGITDEKRKLSTIFTLRNNQIRIISARPMNIRERRAYEKKVQKNTKI